MVVGVKVPKNAAKRQKATKNCSNFLKSNKNLTQTAGVFFFGCRRVENIYLFGGQTDR